jgi:hypothetical protein
VAVDPGQEPGRAPAEATRVLIQNEGTTGCRA